MEDLTLQPDSKSGHEKIDGSNPVCVINELARFHKLKPVYKIEEKHGSDLKVSLSLGSDVWYGSGKDKKTAKQVAAEEAVTKTKLELPKQRIKTTNMKALTPTVKLNGLLMSKGLHSSYNLISQQDVGVQATEKLEEQLKSSNTAVNAYNQQIWEKYVHGNQNQIYNNGNFHLIHAYNNYNRTSANQKHIPRTFRVRLNIEENSFIAEGRTMQLAKHAAAQKALKFFENQVEPQDEKCNDSETVLKSEVTALFEAASAYGVVPKFTLLSEEGPRHLKHYVIKLEVGVFVDEQVNTLRANVCVTGEGKSKKVAKRNAAITALKQMETWPEPKKTVRGKKLMPDKAKDSGPLHPVSRLLQIMQAKKIDEPSYKVVDNGTSAEKKTRFVVECTAQGETVSAKGPSKKEAKKASAELMLNRLKYRQNPAINTTMQPTKSSMKKPDNPDSSPPSKLKLPQRRVSFA